MQKIIIKYLGPVRELEMEIKDFNLFIGEQATGKSTVAKLSVLDTTNRQIRVICLKKSIR